MKAKLFLLVFVVMGGAWALIVSVYGVSLILSFAGVVIPAPYAGIALGSFGGWWIGAIGLRLSTKAAFTTAIRRMNAEPRHEICNGVNPLVACQNGHREPYFDPRVS